MAAPPPTSHRPRLLELAAVSLKLGLISFGGPAVHIALLENEVVARRNWMSRQHFLDLLGVTNLIPGPNSTEMMLHVGYERGGIAGMLITGAGFILPATLITGTLSWLYVHYGTLPSVAPFLAGIKPVVFAIILAALWRLGKVAAYHPRLWVLGLIVMSAVIVGLDEINALIGGTILGTLWFWSRARIHVVQGTSLGLINPSDTTASGLLALGSSAAAVSLSQLFWFFLKVGAVLYGSGYTLVAFLEGGLVRDRGWLTQAQLLDAIAVGQFTPGPLLSTATFIGYVLAGFPGAAVATVGIFLPAFVLVAVVNPLVPYLRHARWSAAFLDAVNIAALGIMAAVALRLGMQVLTTFGAWVLAVTTVFLFLRFRLHPAWLIAGGALVGWLFATA
jgi:chromate transporter